MRQTTTVNEYVQYFKILAGRTKRVPDEQLLGYFLAGLKEDIRNQVRQHDPQEWMVAMRITRDVEEFQRVVERSEDKCYSPCRSGVAEWSEANHLGRSGTAKSEEFQGSEKERTVGPERERIVESEREMTTGTERSYCYSYIPNGLTVKTISQSLAERSEAIEDQSSGGRTSSEVKKFEAKRYNPGRSIVVEWSEALRNSPGRSGVAEWFETNYPGRSGAAKGVGSIRKMHGPIGDRTVLAIKGGTIAERRGEVTLDGEDLAATLFRVVNASRTVECRGRSRTT
ncbi:hypothetical protein LR48_Vigan303s001100 [Vigna angularis]|uniref:Retrotransposon gag domain-containing protein n=1 Tax=Phaseolus angularis TaxID=3914 RepID=A0A0L9T913_PHAAN|nr:hypothetical protein LR48_Vigan303s001100 [Vigna angularis]